MRLESLEGMTGMATGKKPTRRGKRRAKGDHKAHVQHMAEMKRCVECQDHAGAKRAAFSFIKALPAGADEPEMEHNAAEEMAEPAPVKSAPAQKKGSVSPALLAYLKKKAK